IRTLVTICLCQYRLSPRPSSTLSLHHAPPIFSPETITLSSTQAVKSSVTNGLGLTLLSHHTIGEELKTGSLKIINRESTELSRYFHLLTPDVKFHSKSTRTLVDMFNEDSIETHHFKS